MFQRSQVSKVTLCMSKSKVTHWLTKWLAMPKSILFLLMSFLSCWICCNIYVLIKDDLCQQKGIQRKTYDNTFLLITQTQKIYNNMVIDSRINTYCYDPLVTKIAEKKPRIQLKVSWFTLCFFFLDYILVGRFRDIKNIWSNGCWTKKP